MTKILTEGKENERSLIVTQSQEIKTDAFDNSRIKRRTSLNMNDDEQMDMFIESMSDVDMKLNDCVNQEIVCIGATINEYPQDTTNEETGELIKRYKHTLILYDEDGKTYVTGSSACYQSFCIIATLKGMPSKENPIKLMPIKKPSKDDPTHNYLKIKLVK